MIYNHYTQPKIFSESSKNCQKQVLFTPTETSPISYSTQTLNSKEKYLRKINTDDLEKKKNIKFNIPEKNSSSSSKNSQNSRTSSPEINRRRLDDDIDNDINIEFHPIKKKSGNSKSQARGIKKSLKLFNEQFDTLVGTITSNPKKDFISCRNCSIKQNFEEDKKEDNNKCINLEKKKHKKKHHHRNYFNYKVYTPHPQEIRKFPSPIELEIKSLEEEAKSMTNTVEIANFYEYTRNCMKIIVDIIDQKLTVKRPNKVKILNPNKRKKLAVFDLDETLIHGVVNINKFTNKDNIISITLPSKKIAKVGVNIRPHWKEAIEAISKLYAIVVYTASHASYANSVLDFLDPEKKYFYNRLYRSNCIDIKLNGKDIYIKDLEIFEDFDLKDILIVDNSVLAFAFHLDNGIPILPYYNAEKDFELLFCAYYFESIYNYDDLRVINKQNMKLDYYMDQALKEKKEEEEEENDVKEQSDNTPISNFPFDVVKDKNIKGKSTVALCYVFKNEEKEISRTNSKFCEEFKVDLKRLRRKFSQDNLY
jgi:CTD small phosphatase-like protein 2